MASTAATAQQARRRPWRELSMRLDFATGCVRRLQATGAEATEALSLRDSTSSLGWLLLTLFGGEGRGRGSTGREKRGRTEAQGAAALAPTSCGPDPCVPAVRETPTTKCHAGKSQPTGIYCLDQESAWGSTAAHVCRLWGRAGLCRSRVTRRTRAGCASNQLRLLRSAASRVDCGER